MKITKSAQRVCSVLFAMLLTLAALCATACGNSGHTISNQNIDKATIKVTMGEANAKTLAPASAVKYRVFLYDKEGLPLEGYGFAAEGKTDKDFPHEYTENGDSRSMIVKTGAMSAAQMRVACYDESKKYMGSGFVTGMKLASNRYYSYDNTSPRDNSFDYYSAEDEAVEGELAVTANPSEISVGQKSTLKALYTNADGFCENVTENTTMKFTTESENIKLDGSEVTALADGVGVVAASLTLTSEVRMESSVNIYVGERTSYTFLRKVEGNYIVINSLLLDKNESLEADIAYGSVDAEGNTKIFAGKYAVKTYTDEESNGFLTVEPSGVSTETAHVTANTAERQDGAFIYFEPDDCPGVICASLPVAVISSGGGSRGSGTDRFLEKLEDGSYKEISALSFTYNKRSLTVAFGDIDASGNVKLYDSKFWARDCFEEPNGFITVTPSGTNTKECTVVIDYDKPHNCNYLYCEPENCPGVLGSSIGIIF